MSTPCRAAGGPQRHFVAGETIFREGEPGREAFIVCDGAIEIAKECSEGAVVLARCEAGAIFGEMALIDDAVRSASARALTRATCLVVSKDRFRHLLDEADPFIRGLLRILVANVRENNNGMTLSHQVLGDLGGPEPHG